MLLQASQIVGLPVGSTDTQEKVGAIASVIVDPDDGRLLGFTVKTSLWGAKKVLSWHDVIGLDHSICLVRDPDVILPPDEVAPLKKALADKRPILDQKVITESDTNLGKVTDLVLNTDTGMATKLYVSHLLEERIINMDQVIKVTREKIIVKDDVVLGKALTETVPA